MSTPFEIRQQETAPIDDKKVVDTGLRAHNDQFTGGLPRKRLNLFAYAPDDRVIGGLFADIVWGWLHVDILWVDEAHRKDGVGTSLMDRAESEARTLEAFGAYLETADFQAREFYEKRGYTVFAQLDDHPPGHVCYFMKKVGLDRG